MRNTRIRIPLVILATLAGAAASAAAELPKFTRTEDVIYHRKHGTALTLDVFTPAEPNGAAVVFVVSGGWFSGHQGIDVERFVAFLRHGYTVFPVVHGSQPKFTIPEIVEDMHRAVRFIRYNADRYGIDPDRIGITGGSAGGHLSLMIGMAGGPGPADAKDPIDRVSSQVQAVACFFPPSDFINYGEDGRDVFTALSEELKAFKAPFDFTEYNTETRQLVLIGDVDRRREIARQISPVSHVTPDDAPTMILHGDADKLVPIQQAHVMITALEKAGVPAKLIIKQQAGHGWPNWIDDISVFADWFDEHLAGRSAPVPELVSVQKIWDLGPHNAFTDLIRFKDAWFCTFREGEHHVGGNGALRVLTSKDGEQWTSAALLTEDGIDLRDPKLSITPNGLLMMTAGGSVYEGKKLVGRQPRVAFSTDGLDWTPTQRVLAEGDWLWRVTWHEGKAYGVSYGGPRATATGGWQLSLWTSPDGMQYERITALEVPDSPNETTLRFMPDGTMMALVRREAGDRHAWIGTSRKPFTEWTWHGAGHPIGGPDFIVLPDGAMWAAGRNYGDKHTTALGPLSRTAYEPLLTLPSGGDCSYPGLVWHDDLLWVSYYSSHEGKTNIYLAKVRLPARRKAVGTTRPTTAP